NRHFDHFTFRASKPFSVRRQGRKYVEHNRRSSLGSREACPSLAVCVTYPHTNHVLRRNTNGPGIAKPIARPRFPGNYATTAEMPPSCLFTGSIKFLQGIEGQVQR